LFVATARRLATNGLGCADIVRSLQALSGAVGAPAPSYHSVRRITAPVRNSDSSPNPYLEEIVTKLLTGRFPDLYRVSARIAFEEKLALS
jgi:hypothetical protein